jgi:hypothetical protein
MGRGVAIGVASGALVAACFSAPSRPGGSGAIDDSGINGDGNDPDAETFVIPDGNPASCTTDLFLGSGSGNCGPSGWGTLAGPGWANLTGTTSGELNLGLSSGGGTEECSSQQNAWNRVTVDVQAVAASTAAEHTFIGIANATDSEAWGVDFSYDTTASGTAVKVSCGPASAVRSLVFKEWNPVTQRYMQVERTAPGTLAFRASPDNVTYSPLGSCTVSDVMELTTARVRLSIATTASGTAVSARFGHIELCHD